MEAAGFTVLPASAAYRNNWIVKNRLEGKVGLFKMKGAMLEPMEFPVTHLLLLAEKRVLQ